MPEHGNLYPAIELFIEAYWGFAADERNIQASEVLQRESKSTSRKSVFQSSAVLMRKNAGC